MSNQDSAEPATTQAQPDPYAPTLATIWSISLLIQELRRFTSQSDFAALCLLSRKFHDMGNYFLYESAILYSKDKNDTRSIMAFYRTLITQTELAGCVRSLQYVSRYPNHWKERELSILESSHLCMLSDLIKKLFRLEALFILDYFLLSSQAVQELNQSLNSLPSLRHLEFDLQAPMVETASLLRSSPDPFLKYYDVDISILKKALTLPSIRSLALTLQESFRTSTSQTLTLPTNNSITKLSLNDLFVTTETLRAILTALPRVTELNLQVTIYHDIDTPKSSHLNCQELDETLMAYAPTLESLRILTFFCTFAVPDDYLEYGGGENEYWGISSTLNLRRYTTLKHLMLAPEMLLGWKKESSADLSTCLPDCLESLHFRLDYQDWYASPWDNKNLCEKLQQYIPYACRSSLKRLTVEREFSYEPNPEPIKISFASIKLNASVLGFIFS